jgi:hypothetical protein
MEMVDEGSSQTLVLVAAILELFFMLGYGAIAIFFLFGNLLIISGDPTNPIIGLGWGMFGLFAFLAVTSLFLMIVWFIWRTQPSQHRTALIITGVIGLLTSLIPGILVIIAGAIAPSPEALPQRRPAPMPVAPKSGAPRHYCEYCGAIILDPDARFCGTCGKLRK